MGAGRLLQLANALKVEVGFFFEGAPGQPVLTPEQKVLQIGLFGQNADRAMAKAFISINDDEVRRHLIELTQRIGQIEDPDLD